MKRLCKIREFLDKIFDACLGALESGLGMFRRVDDSMNYFRNINLGLVDCVVDDTSDFLNIVLCLVDDFIDNMNAFLNNSLSLVNGVLDICVNISLGVLDGGVDNVVDGFVFLNSILGAVDVFLEVIPNMVQVILDVSFDS